LRTLDSRSLALNFFDDDLLIGEVSEGFFFPLGIFILVSSLDELRRVDPLEEFPGDRGANRLPPLLGEEDMPQRGEIG